MADPDALQYVYSPPTVVQVPEYHEDVYPDYIATINKDSADKQHSVSLELREESVTRSRAEIVDETAISTVNVNVTADENVAQDPPFMPLFKYSMTKDAIRRRIYRTKQIAKREGRTDDDVVDPALLGNLSSNAENSASDPGGIDPITGRPWSPGTVPYRRNFQYSTKKDAVRKRRKRVALIQKMRKQGLPIPKKTSRKSARSRSSSTSSIICDGVFPALTTPKKKFSNTSSTETIVTDAMQIFGPSSVLVVRPQPPRPVSPGSMPYRVNFNYSTNKESLKKRRQRLKKMGHKYNNGKLLLSMTKDAIKKRRQRAKKLGLTFSEDNAIPPESFISQARPVNLANPLENNTVVPLSDIRSPASSTETSTNAASRVYKLVNYSMKPDAVRKRRKRLAQIGKLLNEELALPTESLVLMPNMPAAPSREAVIVDGNPASSSADQSPPRQQCILQTTPRPQQVVLAAPTKGRLNPGQCVYRAITYSNHKEAVRKRKQRLRKKAAKLAQVQNTVENVTVGDND